MIVKKNNISLKSWFGRVWIGLFVFLLLVYFMAQSYMLRILTGTVEDRIQNGIYIAENGIERSLEIVDSFIFESLYSGATQKASLLYNSLKNERDPVELLSVRNTVVSSMQSIISWSDMIDFIMIYTDRDDEDSWLEAGTQDDYISRKEVKAIFENRVETGEINHLDRYMIVTGDHKNYMIRLLKIEGSFFIVCVSENEILNTLQKGTFSSDSIIFAADSKGNPIMSTRALGEKLLISNEGEYISIDGLEYLQTGYVSEKTGYYFGILTEKSSITSYLWVFRIVFFAVIVFLLFSLPASFYIIRRYVERPISKVAKKIDQISEGELDVIIKENYHMLEITQLISAFNHMVERIKQLKIEKYEVKLEAQKATTQYLQLQIKPHFYANMLNIIYALAERREYDTIQKISSAIVNYSRYMFSEANDLVELRREIEHVKYYMEIQDIRNINQVVFNLDVEDGNMSSLVPPFIIQSFVENSVKHAFLTKKVCEINVKVYRDGDNETLWIIVSDNGYGYPEEIMNSDWDKKNKDGHIGLYNIYHRIQLIYRDKAEIILQNKQGAVTIIKIPYIDLNQIDMDVDS